MAVEIQDEMHASNSCRTCRQKRIKCDRLLPTCQRCSSLKLRCLGYERSKTIRWTDSMASRGRLKGKVTFNDSATSSSFDVKLAGIRSSVTNLPRSLIDPGLQDMPQGCRNYIHYFNLELSKECVIYNNPAANPFLALLPLMPYSQALYHAMIYISAFHYTHRIVVNQAENTSHDTTALSRPPKRWYTSHDHEWQKNQPNYGPALHTALLNKQQALECLKREGQISLESNNDAVIAAATLFICLDVVEFGSRGWTHHLRGAQELIRTRKSNARHSLLGGGRWLQYFDTACTTFEIMGATLAPEQTIYSQGAVFFDTAFLQTLKESEHQTWVGCPAELLWLLHILNSMRSVPKTSQERLEISATLLDTLSRFSSSTWANDFPNPQHYEARYHLAHAYKAAVEVYTSHVVRTSSRTVLLEPHISDITRDGISHMLQIRPDDFHIKSLVWPACILGVEAHEECLRKAVQQIFQSIWVSSCCYNVKRAAAVLDMIWTRTDVETKEKTGLEYLWAKSERWLFI